MPVLASSSQFQGEVKGKSARLQIEIRAVIMYMDAWWFDSIICADCSRRPRDQHTSAFPLDRDLEKQMTRRLTQPPNIYTGGPVGYESARGLCAEV